MSTHDIFSPNEPWRGIKYGGKLFGPYDIETAIADNCEPLEYLNSNEYDSFSLYFFKMG